MLEKTTQAEKGWVLKEEEEENGKFVSKKTFLNDGKRGKFKSQNQSWQPAWPNLNWPVANKIKYNASCEHGRPLFPKGGHHKRGENTELNIKEYKKD